MADILRNGSATWSGDLRSGVSGIDDVAFRQAAEKAKENWPCRCS